MTHDIKANETTTASVGFQMTVQVVPVTQSDFAALMAALQEKRAEAIKNAYKNRMAGVFGLERPKD